MLCFIARSSGEVKKFSSQQLGCLFSLFVQQKSYSIVKFLFLFTFYCFLIETSQNAPGTLNFDTFWNTMYNLFVGMTTANYPDLMMPIFTEYRISSLYFVSFMIIMYFILLNIILAYFYYNYKEELIKELRSFQRASSQ